MFNLGLMYEKHRGVSSDAQEEDLLEATRECYEAAAEAGVTKAMVRPFVVLLLRNHWPAPAGILPTVVQSIAYGGLSSTQQT